MDSCLQNVGYVLAVKDGGWIVDRMGFLIISLGACISGPVLVKMHERGGLEEFQKEMGYAVSLQHKKGDGGHCI